MHTFYEFFAGGGMARLGLGASWKCLFANEISIPKANCYRGNFGGDELKDCDIADLRADNIPGEADLAWASFPCQDLSVAGRRAGLAGTRSSTVWEFLRLIRELGKRSPKLLVLENVTGLVSSNSGDDLRLLLSRIRELGYSCAPLVVDAALFLPQTRARLFLICSRVGFPSSLVSDSPCPTWHPRFLVRALREVPITWLCPPVPAAPPVELKAVLQPNAHWTVMPPDSPLLRFIGPQSRIRLQEARNGKVNIVGFAINRKDVDKNGFGSRRGDWRFGGPSYCLTARGRLFHVIRVRGNSIQQRHLTDREMARLMGLPEKYQLPQVHGHSSRLLGEGVAVPVVSWLARNVLEPSLSNVAKSGSL